MNITANLQAVHKKIHQAEIQHCCSLGSVSLLAVSKTHCSEAICAAIAAGQLAFGESYVQEAIPKITAIAKTHSNVTWHYIGRIQSNKIKYLAQHFSWVQSVTKKEQAEHLSLCRPNNLPVLNVCIEVNLSAESSKAGVDVTNVLSLAQEINKLPRLKLRGLMSIPAAVTEFTEQLAAFKKLAVIYHTCNEDGLGLDTLSIGMSDDFEAAIAAGSTMVRIGTAIFGPRIRAN